MITAEDISKIRQQISEPTIKKGKVTANEVANIRQQIAQPVQAAQPTQPVQMTATQKLQSGKALTPEETIQLAVEQGRISASDAKKVQASRTAPSLQTSPALTKVMSAEETKSVSAPTGDKMPTKTSTNQSGTTYTPLSDVQQFADTLETIYLGSAANMGKLVDAGKTVIDKGWGKDATTINAKDLLNYANRSQHNNLVTMGGKNAYNSLEKLIKDKDRQNDAELINLYNAVKNGTYQGTEEDIQRVLNNAQKQYHARFYNKVVKPQVEKYEDMKKYNELMYPGIASSIMNTSSDISSFALPAVLTGGATGAPTAGFALGGAVQGENSMQNQLEHGKSYAEATKSIPIETAKGIAAGEVLKLASPILSAGITPDTSTLARIGLGFSTGLGVGAVAGGVTQSLDLLKDDPDFDYIDWNKVQKGIEEGKYKTLEDYTGSKEFEEDVANSRKKQILISALATAVFNAANQGITKPQTQALTKKTETDMGVKAEANKYLKTLGLEEGASKEQVKSAFRSLSKQYHPDVNPGDEEPFKQIAEAYTELTKNPKFAYVFGEGVTPTTPTIKATPTEPTTEAASANSLITQQPNAASTQYTPTSNINAGAAATQVANQVSQPIRVAQPAPQSQIAETPANNTAKVTENNALNDIRGFKEVGNKQIKAYQYENPEVKPFFQYEAKSLLTDLDNSIKGERYANQVNGELLFGGNKRSVTQDIADLLDGNNGVKLTYEDIRKGLNAIINDNGAENIAAAKRIELVLDKRLREGYTDYQGLQHDPSENYKKFLNGQEYMPPEQYDFEQLSQEYGNPNGLTETQQNEITNYINDLNKNTALDETFKENILSQFDNLNKYQDFENIKQEVNDYMNSKQGSFDLPNNISIKDPKGREIDHKIHTHSTSAYSNQVNMLKYFEDEDGNAVAKVNYSYYDGKIYVNMIETLPEYRRKGLATRLIKDLEKDAREEGMDIDYGYTTSEGTKLLNSIGNETKLTTKNTTKTPKKVFKKNIADRFKELTGDPIDAAGSKIAGAELRNYWRKTGQRDDKLEPYPYSDEAMELWDEWQNSKNTSSHLYHATGADRLESIIKNGLTTGNKPNYEGTSSSKEIYLSATPENAEFYAPKNSVTLRISPKFYDKFENFREDWLGGAGTYAITNNIPPEMLQIKENNKWIPLLKSKLAKQLQATTENMMPTNKELKKAETTNNAKISQPNNSKMLPTADQLKQFISDQNKAEMSKIGEMSKALRLEETPPSGTPPTEPPTEIASGGEPPEPPDDKIAELLKQRPQKARMTKKEMAENAYKTLVNKGYFVDKLADTSGNQQLKYKYDKMLASANEGNYVVGEKQTDNEGNIIGKSVNEIWKPVENAGKVEEFSDYLLHKLNIDRMSLEDIDAIIKADTDLTEFIKNNPEVGGLSPNKLKKLAKGDDANAEKARQLIELDRQAEILENRKNKPVFGKNVTADDSRKIVAEYENKYPEFKEWDKDIKTFNKNQLQNMVDAGLTNEETQELLNNMYDNYIRIQREVGGDRPIVNQRGRLKINSPIKKAKGGNQDILPLKDSMAQQAVEVKKAIARNQFGLELLDTIGEGVENPEYGEVLKAGKNGEAPTFTVFKDGKPVTMKINQELYDAIKPSERTTWEDSVIARGLQKAVVLQKTLLTSRNPIFAFTNFVRDLQTAIVNSKDTTKMLGNYAKLVKYKFHELYSDKTGKPLNADDKELGRLWDLYKANGGESNTYFDFEKGTNLERPKNLKGFIGNQVDKIFEINEIIEQLPRVSEFITTLENGGTIEEAMYNAADITVNFKRGGEFTKMLDRNGASFLNASVQGLDKQIRNFANIKNGGKGWAKMVITCALLGIAPQLINHLLLHNDEDYQDLPDYIKDNYWLFKIGDNKFLRIPRGRDIPTFLGTLAQRTSRAIEGDDRAFEGIVDTFSNTLAPNNPLDSNIYSPISSVITNRSWNGSKIVSSTLENKVPAEQYDAKDTEFAKWLGKNLNYSPKKIDYLIDQYTGGIGDILIPLNTKYAEEGNPLSAKFSTDSINSNKQLSRFYDDKTELTQKKNSGVATDVEQYQYKYLSDVGDEISEKNKQIREIELSDMKEKEKIKQVNELRQEMNTLAKEANKNLKKYGEAANDYSDDIYEDIFDSDLYKNAYDQEKFEKKIRDKVSADANLKAQEAIGNTNAAFKLNTTIEELEDAGIPLADYYLSWYAMNNLAQGSTYASKQKAIRDNTDLTKKQEEALFGIFNIEYKRSK